MVIQAKVLDFLLAEDSPAHVSPVREAEGGGRREPVIAAPESRVSHLLMVEDDEAYVYLMRRAFRNGGLNCDLTVIHDRAAALAFLGKPETSGAELPDLAVLDLNLPKKNGAEVLKAFRLNNRTSDIPVVVITGSTCPRDEAKIEELGVDAYLTKPADLEKFDQISAALKTILLNSAGPRPAPERK